LRQPPAPELLISYAQFPSMGMTFLVHTRNDLPGIDAQMADALWTVLPREAITRQFTLTGELDAQLETVRFFGRTVAAFALAALVLAALGVYAVAALQQQRRTAEFGLRLAIGARPRDLVGQIMRDCLGSAALGVALGLFGAWGALQLIANQLSDSGTQKLSALFIGALLMSVIAVAAALLPALRAARSDPMASLRHE
jgi:ABC-type antimicrobial peptide transport system permease subunit